MAIVTYAITNMRNDLDVDRESELMERIVGIVPDEGLGGFVVQVGRRKVMVYVAKATLTPAQQRQREGLGLH